MEAYGVHEWYKGYSLKRSESIPTPSTSRFKGYAGGRQDPVATSETTRVRARLRAISHSSTLHHRSPYNDIQLPRPVYGTFQRTGIFISSSEPTTESRLLRCIYFRIRGEVKTLEEYTQNTDENENDNPNPLSYRHSTLTARFRSSLSPVKTNLSTPASNCHAEVLIPLTVTSVGGVRAAPKTVSESRV